MDLKKDLRKSAIVYETIAHAKRWKQRQQEWFGAYFVAIDEGADHDTAVEVADLYMEQPNEP